MSSKDYLLNEVREAWNTDEINHTATIGCYTVRVHKTSGLLGKILDILGWNTRHVTVTAKSLDKRDAETTSAPPSVTFKCDDFSDFNKEIRRAREEIRTKNFEENLEKVIEFRCIRPFNTDLGRLIMSRSLEAITAKIFQVLVVNKEGENEVKELNALEVLQEYRKLAKNSPERKRTEVEDRILQDVRTYLEKIRDVPEWAKNINKYYEYNNCSDATIRYLNHINDKLDECKKCIAKLINAIDCN
jgi:hypothetical protein